jgi:hypothetical protein
MVADTLRQYVCAHLQVALNKRTAQRFGFTVAMQESFSILVDTLI